MDRLFLSHLSVQNHHGEHVFQLGWYDERGHEQRIRTVPDLNLGHIMGSLSAMLKTIESIERHLPKRPTVEIGGPITLESWTIEPMVIAPYRWHMKMTTDRFSYAVNMDADLENVILAFSGALKFFCFKHGLTTLDDGIVRHRDRAGELGLLTKEDFPS